MMELRIAYVTYNLWDYDPVISPPLGNLCDSFYITESRKNYNKALLLGWSKAILTHIDAYTPKLERRKETAEYRLYPERFIKELTEYDLVIMCDSNVKKLHDDFLNYAKSIGNNVLLLDAHFYKGDENNLYAEYDRTFKQKRWAYDFKNITYSMERYAQIVNLNQCKVCSAKYKIWNYRHPRRQEIADWIYDEKMKHIQGNIILSEASQLFDDYIKVGDMPRIGKQGTINHRKHTH